MIYLDNAATTLHKPRQVIKAVAQAMDNMGNSARGTHSGALCAARTVYGARVKLALLFGCEADHVVFTSNSTEALNIASAGIICPGDRVISTDLEHNSVLRPLYRLEAESDVQLSFVPLDKRSGVDYADFKRLVRPNTRAIVCTHASNLTGDMLDVARIGAFAHEHGITFIVDASQTAGCFPINMQEMGIDVLCFTGHKGLMGPQGTGGLCVGEGVELRPFLVGGTGVHSYSETQPEDYPTRLEAGTLNSHGLAGLGAALDFLKSTGPETIRRHEQALSRRFYEAVRDLPGVRVYGDFSAPERAAIVALNIGDLDSSQVSDELAERFGIATRPGAHCAPRLHRCLGTVDQGAVRFSWSWFNTQEETDTAAEAVAILAKEAE